MHYSLFIQIQFSDMPIISESDTDSTKTGKYTLYCIHHSLLKDTYTFFIYSGMEYLELPVKTPSASPSTGTRHYRRGRTLLCLNNFKFKEKTITSRRNSD